MADIRRNQGRLQEAHERSKTVTRSEEMKKLREQMQVRGVGWGCGARARCRVPAKGRLPEAWVWRSSCGGAAPAA